eukprot:104791-Pyramimonas_sp.AAC.1
MEALTDIVAATGARTDEYDSVSALLVGDFRCLRRSRRIGRIGSKWTVPSYLPRRVAPRDARRTIVLPRRGLVHNRRLEDRLSRTSIGGGYGYARPLGRVGMCWGPPVSSLGYQGAPVALLGRYV